MKNAFSTTKMKVAAAVMMTTVAIVSGGSFAHAAVPDPLDGALATSATGAQAWVTTYGVPVMAAAILFGALIGIGFRWLRRIITTSGRA